MGKPWDPSTFESRTFLRVHFRQRRAVSIAVRSHGGSSEKFTGIWALIFRSRPGSPLEISNCNTLWGNFLEIAPEPPERLRSSSRNPPCGACYGSSQFYDSGTPQSCKSDMSLAKTNDVSCQGQNPTNRRLDLSYLVIGPSRT